jgi:hypothetical protein
MVLPSIARFNRRLPGARHRWSDEPGCSVGAFLTLGNELDRMVCDYSVQLCFATNRPGLVIGYEVRLVPTLMRRLQASNKRLCQHRIADVRANTCVLRRCGGRYLVVHGRSSDVA